MIEKHFVHRCYKTTCGPTRENRTSFPLQEIDPFTFFAGFNRGIRQDNRQKLWAFLKDEWRLDADVPEDFDGLPTANHQNSWLTPYAARRSPDHVPTLWKFYEHILSAPAESLDAAFMQECLSLPQVGLAFLTMGMFWSCPRKWIATDHKNIAFAETKGIPSNLRSA